MAQDAELAAELAEKEAECAKLKLLETNSLTSWYPPGRNDSADGLPLASDVLRTALTAFCQFGLRDKRCNVDACAEEFHLMRPVV